MTDTKQTILFKNNFTLNSEAFYKHEALISSGLKNQPTRVENPEEFIKKIINKILKYLIKF